MEKVLITINLKARFIPKANKIYYVRHINPYYEVSYTTDIKWKITSTGSIKDHLWRTIEKSAKMQRDLTRILKAFS